MPDRRGFTRAYAEPDGRRRTYCVRCGDLGAWLPTGTNLDEHARAHDRDERAARTRAAAKRRRDQARRLRLVTRLRTEARR